MSENSTSPVLAYLRQTLREQDPSSIESAVTRHLLDCIKRFEEGSLEQAARIADTTADAYLRFSRMAELNDHLRKTFTGGQVVLTRGVAGLPPEDKAAVLQKVREFDQFSGDNDPWGEHDFGSFKHDGTKIFWKIDYFDPKLEFHSEDPCDPAVTTRVLTIMLAEEY